MFLTIDEWLIMWAQWSVRQCELLCGISRQSLISIVQWILICAVIVACILSLTIFFLIEVMYPFVFLYLGLCFGWIMVTFVDYISSKCNASIPLNEQVRIGRPLRALLLVFVVGFLISLGIMIFDAGELSLMNLNEVLLFDLLFTLMFSFALVCMLEYLRCTNSISKSEKS